MAAEQQQETIYEGRGSNRFYSPFHLRVEPMERLLLINWQEGQFYKGAEPQWLDDEQHGQGLLVILYRVDGKVDVYHQPGLRLNPAAYQIEAGLGQLVPTDFERARFQITAEGLDVDIAFADLDGRPIALRIHEQGGERAGRFALLAPLGETIEAPEAMPLFFLYDFSFVKVGGTEVRLSVAGEEHQMMKLPVPLGGHRVYLTRYCGDPFISFWNEGTEGPLPGMALQNFGPVTLNGVRYALVQHEGYNEIAAMARGLPAPDGEPGRQVRISFHPAFPDVTALRDGARVSGRFRIGMAPDGEAGEVGGEWHVTRYGDLVRLDLRPSEGWQPGERALMPRLIFTLVRPFKQWPKSYEWTAIVDLSKPGEPHIKSGWRRLPR